MTSSTPSPWKGLKSISPKSSNVKLDPKTSSKWHLLKWQFHYDHICRIYSPQCKESQETARSTYLTFLIYKLQMYQNFQHPALWRILSSERSVWINKSASNEGCLRELESEAASIHGLLPWHLLFSPARLYLCAFLASHLYFNEFLFTL